MSKELDKEGVEILLKLNRLDTIFKDSVVSFDVDGVEADSGILAIQSVNQDLGTNFKKSDLTTYWGLTKLIQDTRPDVANPAEYAGTKWNHPDNLAKAGYEAGAFILASHLNSLGTKMYRITSRPGAVYEATLDWYSRKFPFIDKESIIVQKNHGAPISPSFKAEMVAKYGVKFHFEDSVEHARAIVSSTDALVILVPQPWNIDYIHSKPKEDARILVPFTDWQASAKLARVYMGLIDLV